MVMRNFNVTQIGRWINQTSLQSLEKAYQSALTIKRLEDSYFEGGPIAAQPGKATTVTDYFKTQLDRQLLKVRTNLLQFRITGFLVGSPLVSQISPEVPGLPKPASPDAETAQLETFILEKLTFIESVVGKYRIFNDLFDEMRVEPDKSAPITVEELSENPIDIAAEAQAQSTEVQDSPIQWLNLPKKTGKPKHPKNPNPTISGRLFSGVSQLGREFSPRYEQEVVQELRIRRAQNRMAVRWLVILLIVPVLIQIAVRHVILNPVLGNYSDRNPTKIELSEGIEERFLGEYSKYKEALEVKTLLAKSLAEQERERLEKNPKRTESEKALAKAVFGDTPVEMLQDTLSSQVGNFRGLFIASETPEAEIALEEKALQEKALDLWREARNEQLNGLKNVLADGIGLAAFAGLIYFGRRKFTLVREFSNRAFLGLSDPTKVFLFILITDMFVGFHSAEGWEVILEGALEHVGLPESKALINGFIATVPVIIDSCIKFWIFSYLTRYSPSASAIYERMNT